MFAVFFYLSQRIYLPVIDSSLFLIANVNFNCSFNKKLQPEAIIFIP